jgi:hypothetical protein
MNLNPPWSAVAVSGPAAGIFVSMQQDEAGYPSSSVLRSFLVVSFGDQSYDLKKSCVTTKYVMTSLEKNQVSCEPASWLIEIQDPDH